MGIIFRSPLYFFVKIVGVFKKIVYICTFLLIIGELFRTAFVVLRSVFSTLSHTDRSIIKHVIIRLLFSIDNSFISVFLINI